MNIKEFITEMKKSKNFMKLVHILNILKYIKF